MATKVHYLPIQFSGAQRVFCDREIKVGTLFSGSWAFVTCKDCKKGVAKADRFAKFLHERYGATAMEVTE